MDEQFNSIVEQLNRLVKKQTGLSPRAKTIERALKHFVDNYSGGGAGGDSIWGNIIGSIENQTDLINKIDEMIDDELANFEHLDYEVVDTIPTPATAEEGVRYLYKPAGATAYNEYILIGGTIYNIGSTEDINLDNYYTKTEVDAELNGKADVSDLPTKTSDLTNDSQFVDKDTNELTNYTTTTAMNNALNLKADKTTTYTKDEVNDKLDLKADADDIPTKTSDLTNDSGFITKDVSNLTNYTKTTDLNTALALKANATDIPTKTSDLTNDTGYIDANVNNLTNYTKTTDLNDALNLKADKSTIYTKTEVDTKLKSCGPVGHIELFAGITAPTGYLMCNGSAVSRTTYSDLFTVIGTRYGSGDGSATFNVPNLSGRVPVGYDIGDTDFNVLGKTGGEKTHTLTINEMPEHYHEFKGRKRMWGSNISAVGNVMTDDVDGDSSPSTAVSQAYKDGAVGKTGGNQAHNVVQPYVVMNYIIKY